jgi:hypothetical protein
MEKMVHDEQIIVSHLQSLFSLIKPHTVTYRPLPQPVDGSCVTGEQLLHSCDLVFHSLSLVRSTANADIGLNPYNALLV